MHEAIKDRAAERGGADDILPKFDGARRRWSGATMQPQRTSRKCLPEFPLMTDTNPENLIALRVDCICTFEGIADA